MEKCHSSKLEPKNFEKINKEKFSCNKYAQKVENCKTIIICIGTPINKNNHQS